MARLIIIGGGIGGLAAAACLKARGIEADVYERTGELREVGAALGLWPNATRVLKRIGVLDELIKRAHVPAAGALRAWDGRVLKHMVQLEAEVPSVFAHRADVHRALLAAIPPDKVHLGKNCTGVQRSGSSDAGTGAEGGTGKMRAVFADGTMSDWVDGIVGADGIRSTLREASLRDGMPVYRGYVAWRGVAQFDPEEEVVGETWGRGQRFGFIPLGSGRVGWWATANKPGKQGQETCAMSREEWKVELLERFRDWHPPIVKLLRATPESAILCNAILDRVPSHPPKPWGHGPMTLLGDAAHPTTPNLGQGACMAIEDAAVLSHAVASIPVVETAFRVYEQTRFDRTAMIVRESLKFGKMGQAENPLAVGLRNFMIKMAPEGGLRKQFRDLWFYDAWEAPLVVPKAG
jgi:2-polyprenyl-6-methoxyphenol hydroxylase-like FAD-dependent oxidoreductase